MTNKGKDAKRPSEKGEKKLQLEANQQKKDVDSDNAIFSDSSSDESFYGFPSDALQSNKEQSSINKNTCDTPSCSMNKPGGSSEPPTCEVKCKECGKSQGSNSIASDLKLILAGQRSILKQLDKKCDTEDVKRMMNEERERNLEILAVTNDRINVVEKSLADFKDQMENSVAEMKNLAAPKEHQLQAVSPDPNQFKDASEGIIELTNKIKSLETYIEAIKEKSVADTVINQEESIQEIAQEIHEREIRKKSLMLFNVPESTADTLEERKQHDLDYIQKICDGILDLSNMKKLVRVGNANVPGNVNAPEKIKPLRIDFTDAETAMAALMKSNDIGDKSEQYGQRIYVSQDRTLMQRRQRQKLVKEMKIKRAETEAKNGPERWAIRGNRVMDVSASNKRQF